MFVVDATINLDKFQIVRENEGSQDEPFIWVIGIRFDGVTAPNILTASENAALSFHTPPGRHKNLGSAAEHADNLKPFDIPEAQGVWKTSLRFDPNSNFPVFAPFCTLAIAVVGLEEDSTSNTLAIEAHRRVVEFVKHTLTAELRSILADAITAFGQGDPLPSGQDVEERLTDVLNYRAIKTVIDDFRDSQIPVAVLKGFVNLFTLPGNLAQLDHDEYVGDAQAVYTMPELIANAIDGHKITFELNRDKSFAQFIESRTGIELPPLFLESIPKINMPAKTGHYRITGRTRRTDLREPPTIAAVWTPEQIVVLARGDDRRCFYINSDNGGKSFRTKGWRIAGKGVFTSGMGATTAPDGSLLFVCGRGNDGRIWSTRPSSKLTSLENAGWQQLPPLNSRFGACAALSEAAKRLHVFAVDQERRVRWSWSNDHGASWDLPWGFLGTELLGATPAAAVSADGKRINVFGLDRNRNILRAYSADGGVKWEHLWSRSGLPEMAFSSAPACAVSADGNRVFLVAKGDGSYFFLRSDDAGKNWHKGDGVPAKEWTRFKLPAGNGFFISAPAVCASPDLNEIHLFGVFNDMRMYHRAIVNGKGSDWQTAGDEPVLFA